VLQITGKVGYECKIHDDRGDAPSV